MLRKISGIEKFQAKEGEGSRFSRIFFYLTGPKKLRQGTVLCFKKLLVGSFFCEFEGEFHKFPSKFLSHSTETLHWRTLWFFTKVLLSKTFIQRTGASRLCRSFSYQRKETESFVKEPFCFPEVFWYRKNIWTTGGVSRLIFSRNYHFSQCRKLW